MVIFGANIAKEMAGAVAGLTIAETGEATAITGEPLKVLLKLMNQYQQLSEPVALLQLRLLLDKYPDIFLEYNQPLPTVRLSCALINHNE
jgi:hypothetical protein